MTIPQESALNILHIDSSARPGLSGQDRHGSHSRRLSARPVRRWSSARPQDRIVYRDVGMAPPSHVDAEWTASAFPPPERPRHPKPARPTQTAPLLPEPSEARLSRPRPPSTHFAHRPPPH